MKNISAGLLAAINEGEICSLFSIVANDTTHRHFTDHDVQLTVEGIAYVPSAGVSRLKMKTTSNAEVSNQEIAATILDMPEDELKSGKWDNAQITVSVCSWRNPAMGKLIVFKGGLGVIQWTDEGFRADIQNYLRDLARNIGNTVTAQCRHQLFGQSSAGKISYCGVDRTTYTSTGTVQYILSNRLKFKISSTARPDLWASNGMIKFTSGNNNGLSSEVKIHSVQGGTIGESVELFLPTILPVAIGDTFELMAGCDHTLDTCSVKFGNVARFGGFPNLQVDVNASLATG